MPATRSRLLRVALFSIPLIAFTACAGGGAAAAPPGASPAALAAAVRPTHPTVAPNYRILARRVEIRRTDYGVPHLTAVDFRALGFGMAWCQAEDYGEQAVRSLVAARGESAWVFGDPSAVEGDVWRRWAWERAVETYHLLDQDTRDLMEGFALGMNLYIERHPEEFAEWQPVWFTGHDVSALTVGRPNLALARRFRRSLEEPPGERTDLPVPDPEIGSNAWAFGPERTSSGNAILVRNPHLSWSAGYYEAHLVVPGKVDFYGDIRIGGAFSIIGGFNPHLGWSTTNNAPDLDEIYELEADPQRPDHYLFDGASLPLRREIFRIPWRDEEGRSGISEQELWLTPLGPVIHRTPDRLFVIRTAGYGEFRRGEQYLRMMKANNLDEWREAMRLRAIQSSNYTYADAAGNIFYVWNATLPSLPHEALEDEAWPAPGTEDIWTRFVPFEELPHLLNPPGGYLQNSNDPPHYTNLRAVLDPDALPTNIPEPRLRLRTQHSLQLVDPDSTLSLEDILSLKHSMRMIAADRVKGDLLSALDDVLLEGEAAEGAEVLRQWDNTAAADSRGGVLFEEWFTRYRRVVRQATPDAPDADYMEVDPEIFQVIWDPADPLGTPRGLANPEIAVEVFGEAVAAVTERWGDPAVAWGEVHRVRRGEVDVPVGGGSGTLGCFRVLSFTRDEDGRLVASSGDGWVLAVEFSDPPRAYSILAYGQSARLDSPHHSDQAVMFARNEMKPVRFTEEDIEAHVIRRYHPGGY